MKLNSLPLTQFMTPPRTCSYLPAEKASLEYRVFALMEEPQYAQLLRRGWRRHGAHFFRPQCPACAQCRSLRVRVDEFRPTRSQRRVLNRNGDVRIEVRLPKVTREHVDLFNAYHADMTDRRDWTRNVTDEEDYENSFLIGYWPFAREFAYYRGKQLVGVGLVDVVADAVSSVYFYHRPDWRNRAPGTFSILQEIEFCRRTDRRFNYLGYWIAGCGSMDYKARFQPHELLERYVEEDEEPRWLRPADELPPDGSPPNS